MSLNDPSEGLKTISTTYEPIVSDDIELVSYSLDGEHYDQSITRNAWPPQIEAGLPKHQDEPLSIIEHRRIYRLATSLHALFIFLLISQLALIAYMSIPGFISANAGACTPAGRFELLERAAVQNGNGQYQTLNRTARFNPWTTDTAFQIDMSHGSFSFATAKLIDIVWDMVIGRGGQALLAYISYRVYTKSLAKIMETKAVSRDTFKAVNLQHNTFRGSLALTSSVLRKHDRGTRSTIALMVFCGLFVLAVPTWMSAMTGYTAELAAFVSTTNGNLSPFNRSTFLPIIYTIHDGDRLGEGYTKDTHVLASWEYPYLDASNVYGCHPQQLDGPPCDLLWLVSYYATDYGIGTPNQNQSVFFLPGGSYDWITDVWGGQTISDTASITLEAPTLNISASFYKTQETGAIDYEYDYPVWWLAPTSASYWPTIAPNPLFLEIATNDTWSLGDLEQNGSCQQIGNNYKWGFSFLLLFSFVVTFLVWTIAVYGLYLNTYLHSRLDNVDRHMGVERAVADLAQSMGRLHEWRMYSNTQLETMTKDFRMSYSGILDSTSPNTRCGAKHDWCWRSSSSQSATQSTTQ